MPDPRYPSYNPLNRQPGNPYDPRFRRPRQPGSVSVGNATPPVTYGAPRPRTEEEAERQRGGIGDPYAGPRRGEPAAGPTGFRTPSDFPAGGSVEPGARFLRDIGAEFLIPHLQQQQARGDVLYGQLQESLAVDPGIAAQDFATQATEAFATDLARPGGVISEEISRALGGAVGRGLGPGSGAFASDRTRVAQEAARATGSFFAQNLANLRGQGIQREAGLLQFAQSQEDLLANLIGSIFSVGAAGEQLGLQYHSIRRQT